MRSLFYDCDGVLADFDKRALELFGMPSQEFEDTYGAKEFWKRIRLDDEFFYNLDLMPGALELWEFGKPYKPTILTGVPFGNWAPSQKVRWAARADRLNTDRIITCPSREKKNHGKPGDVLVDDLLKYKHLWVEMGGIFVHHTDVKKTIAELKEIFN